jgi:predicted nucleic acid-binding protein
VDDLSFLGQTLIDQPPTAIAREIRQRTKYSWWDCLLLASALELGCTHFLSEDLQDGHTISGLTIVDPFAHTPEQILASP